VLLPKYAEALAALDRARAWAVHGSGMDELSLAGPSEVRDVMAGVIREFSVDAADLGLARCDLAGLRGGDRAENARILLAILDGTERGPKRDLVLLNSAAGFVVAGLAADLGAGLERARECIVSRRALGKLRVLQA
jgi:anthranilate phosphoribosyltransferase